MADPVQNSKAPVLAPAVPGPDSGGGALGGPTWLAAAEQAWLGRAASPAPRRHRERRSLGLAHHPRATALCGPPASRPPEPPVARPPAPPGRKSPTPTPAPPRRPGGAICPPPSPSVGRADRAVLVSDPAQRPECGRPRRAVTWPSAPGSLGRLGPRAQSADPRSRKRRREERERCSDGGGRGAGGLGAPCGWEDGAQNPSWTGEVSKGSRRVLLQRSRLGWGEIAACDLVVT